MADRPCQQHEEGCPITHAKVLHTRTCGTSPRWLLITYQQVRGYTQSRNRIANHPLSLAEDHEKQVEERRRVQFRRHGAQWRRSGGTFAPGCRSWELRSSRGTEAQTKDGHDLSRSPARAISRSEGALAGLRPGTAHTDRSNHIANISHTSDIRSP
jgi:hypothetical protein